MTKLIIQHLWSDFKKQLAETSPFLFALWTICYFTFGFSTPSASIRLRTCFCTSSFSKIADTLFERTLFFVLLTQR